MAYQEGGGGSGIIFIIFIVIMAIVLFIFFGDRLTITEGIHKSLFDKVNSKPGTVVKDEAKNVVSPPPENEYCKLQEIIVPDGIESYSRDQIIGWDSIDLCCVRQVSGYNCALGRNSSVKYCYTANIGGEIKWTSVEGYYVDSNLYKSFLEDLDKEKIPNKVCDLSKYPEVLR